MIAPALSLAAALLCSSAGATKVALMPLPPSEGLTEKAALDLTEAVAAEIRRVPGVKLITQDEIGALLGLERQKSLLGCTDEKCVAELGGALGVDRLVIGRLSKQGETWMFSLKALDAKKAEAVAQANRNVRKASIDDMIELIPTLVGELFGAAPTKGPVRTVEPPKPDPAKPAKPEPAPTAAPAPTATPYKYGPNGVDEPIDKDTKTEDLKVVTDGKGHYLAFPKPWESGGGRFFYGDGKSFYLVRTTSGGSDGSVGSFNYGLWDPRFRDSYGLDAEFEYRELKYKLTCGAKKKTEVELTRVPEADAKKLLKGAKFFKSYWRRQAYAIARDDEGNYFYVDETADRSATDRDYRFYMGPKGKLVGYALTDRIADSAAEIFVTSAGRLKRKLDGGEGKLAEWIVGPQKVPVSWLALDGQAQLVYTALGVYAGEPLHQPCDAVAK